MWLGVGVGQPVSVAERKDALRHRPDELSVPVRLPQAIELDQRLDRDAVHVEDEPIAAHVIVERGHRESLQLVAV